MKLGEFRALLGCSWSIASAMAAGDRRKLNATGVRINLIHAGINARKAARYGSGHSDRQEGE